MIIKSTFVVKLQRYRNMPMKEFLEAGMEIYKSSYTLPMGILV